MSESPKMGLFGSKDDSAEASDEKKQPVGPSEAAQGRDAPYNIDSDSETYDTEALSILDINDIIGIQAEAAGDSTLESEIAALAEVITDIKSDELPSGVDKTLGGRESSSEKMDSSKDVSGNGNGGSTKDAPKEDTPSQADDNKSPDSAGMAGINKSLLLIGESYISDDSQDEDSDENPTTSAPKSVDLGETVEASINEDADGGSKISSAAVASADEKIAPKETIAAESPAEIAEDGGPKILSPVVASADEKIAPKETIVAEGPAEITEAAASDKPAEPTVEPMEDLKSARVEESADSTDSAATDVSAKQIEEENKTENMDVDSVLVPDVVESAGEKSPCNKSKEDKPTEKFVEDSKSTVAKIEGSPTASAVDAEEPMEVDQPNEEVSSEVEVEKADPVAMKEVEDKPRPSDSVEIEKAATVSESIDHQPEEDKKMIDEVACVEKTSPEPEVCEKSSSDRVTEPETSNSGIEEKVSNVVGQEATESSNSGIEEGVSNVVEQEATESSNSGIEEGVSNVVDQEATESSNSRIEEELSNVVEQETTESSNGTKNEAIAAEKLEMETDEPQVTESPAAESTDNIEIKSPAANIVESTEEAVEETPAEAKDEEPAETTSEEAKVEQEIIPDRPEQLGEIGGQSVMLVERDEPRDNEPMEVDDIARPKESESDNEGPNLPKLSSSNVDIVEPVTDVAVSPKPSDEPTDTTSDSPANASENIEAAPDAQEDNEAVVTSSVASEKSEDVVESISNIAAEECGQNEPPVASESSENSEKIVESASIVSSSESANDKVASDVETAAKSSMIVEAMETEDITVKEDSEEALAAPSPESPEKSSEIVEAVADVIPDVVEPSVVATEESTEDEKMEVDAGAKKEKPEIGEIDVCRSDEVSQKSEESLVSIEQEVAQEVAAMEEKSTTEKVDDLDEITNLDITEKIVEEAVEVPSESTASESGEIETAKSIDETDEAAPELKEKENAPLIPIQKDEPSAAVFEIVATETPDAAAKVEEIEEAEPESKEEETAVPTEESETPSEKSPAMDVAKPPEEPVDVAMEVSNESVKPEAKEAEASISMATAESSTSKIPEIEAVEKLEETTEMHDEEASKEDQPKEEEDKTILVDSTESSVVESTETKKPETPDVITKEDLEVVDDKVAAIIEEEPKESPESVEIPEPSTRSTKIDSTEPPEAITEDIEAEKTEAEAESKETVSTDTSSKMIEEKQSTEAAEEAADEVTKEDTEESKTDSTPEEGKTDSTPEESKTDSTPEESKTDSTPEEEKPPIATEVTAEVVEKLETEGSQKDTEESTSIAPEKEAESHFVSPKTEAPQPEPIQGDLSSAMTSEDVEAEEDPVEEEMNLSLEPEECPESAATETHEIVNAETPHRVVAPSPETATAEASETEETEDQADLNLSFDPEEKAAELPCEKLLVEDSADDSSMIGAAEKPAQSDERLETPSAEEDDDLPKDLLSSMVREPEIFHDEQSQNTQEMMDSILETDSSNFNKILDDEEENAGAAAALACADDLPLVGEAEIDELADKLPSESEELLSKALDDPMSSQNIDSLEGLLDLDLMQEGDESNLKSVEPIVAKVMSDGVEDIETKDMVDVSLLLEETEQGESASRNDYAAAAVDSDAADVLPKIDVEEEEETENLSSSKSPLMATIDPPMAPQLEAAALADADIDVAFDLPIVEPDVAEADPLASEESKLELAEDLLREIAVDEERKMELAGKLLLESETAKDDKIDELPEEILLRSEVEKSGKIELPADLLLRAAVEDEETDVNLPSEVLLSAAAVEAEGVMDLDEEVLLESPARREDPKIELNEDVSLERVVRDQVLTAAAEMEDLPANSEISELESAVKFLQESEEAGIDTSLVLSPKLVDSVVDEIVRDEAVVGIFAAGGDICEDPSALVAELEDIIPDPIAISEAEIITEAAKLESERKSKLREEAKLQSPIATRSERRKERTESTPPATTIPETAPAAATHPETPKTHREPRETAARSPRPERIEQQAVAAAAAPPLLKKSAPIPKISILEERLKEPPKIEIPAHGEVSRICETTTTTTPTTPRTSLLIQRDAKLSSFQKMLESPKASEKTELKIVETPRKEGDKHDFENVGSPRIILKIAKSAIADCGEPRSPKSPKIRSATNSPNPEDSPGQKLGKIKLKLSKGGHPSIISNDNVEEVCGQWHTEGTSSLSPLGMKIKFSKSGDASIVQQTEKQHESTDETTTTMTTATKEPPPKHKFEEAKRTESPIGMKIKFSKSGDASIVQQDVKDSKHKEKLEMMQGSPKRNESPLGMKIKFSKSGDASIIQPEKTTDPAEDHREAAGSSRGKDKLDVPQEAPRRTESPLGMKFKLFKTGDASIVASEIAEDSPQQETTTTKRTDSPLGMKIKLTKTRGGASIVQLESGEERLEAPDVPRRTESPLGMKIKFSRSGDASIIHSEEAKETAKHRERGESAPEVPQPTEATTGVKIKVTKSLRDTLQTEIPEDVEIAPAVSQKRAESSIGMKFKLSKTGDASIVHPETQEPAQEEPRAKEKPEIALEATRKPDAAIGMKIKFSRTGDASIIQPQSAKKSEEENAGRAEAEHQRASETTAGLPMKIKLQRGGDAAIVEPDKREKTARRKETESLPLEMKIKLSKTGHPTIVACDNYGESSQRAKDAADKQQQQQQQQHKDSASAKETPGMKMLKTMQHSGMHGNRAELTIEPIQSAGRKSEGASESSPKRKDVTISPIESKKAKLEAKLSHMLPEVTIQPIKPREPKPTAAFDGKSSSISRQQMNVISQEISITQVRSNKAMDLSMTNKLKTMLAKNAAAATSTTTTTPTTTSAKPDCEIIEHNRPELIIVNENSNSSQDVMIIEEVPALRGPEAKVPKKRGRPRRNPLPLVMARPLDPAALPTDGAIPRDPLALDDVPQLANQMTSPNAPKVVPPRENERPKRSCSRQKSYAPPRRGRGRGGGRGKRKMEMEHLELSKKPRIDQDLTLIEQSTTALITIDEPAPRPEISHSTSELYKALRQPPMDHKMANAMARVEAEQAVNEADLLSKESRESLMDSRIMSHLDGVMNKPAEPAGFEIERKMSLESLCSSEGQSSAQLAVEQMDKTEMMIVDEKTSEKTVDEAKEHNAVVVGAQDHQNWLTPSSKKLLEGRNEGGISSVQVIDEETRMSAESSSRSQTPARNMSLQAPETIVNEESQGSVLSTATTESEKVKVKNRRMEINFDPDEGPFTVDKIAEYEWPLDPTRKSETFMIQEQISQYLGVKSFKRKYPDLKRRMVDMEERNYLRENALVSEAMCDMGLTAVGSSEVLDIMCNDFPDQYEEYRKYIREKQMKEHSKKQKELTAAANAEKNRIDLAEMAVQSALSWNVGLNKARRESRKCSLDLQTFTIHVPKKQQKVEEESRQSHYPVALIPGQYTDYYREYTPAELRYYPLNTVLYGPMKPNERKLDSQSEGSQSDSDSDSSSDDSSSSSSDGTQDTEESQSTMDEVDVELSRQKEDIKSIKCKMCLKHLNKFSRTEVLIQCGTCNGYVHPSCIDLTLDMVPHIQAYAWQCTDCKTCAQCHDPADEDKMLFCDMCDRGYHIYCVGLRRVPQGRWHCQECAVCASCGSREAGGANSDRNSVAQWQHEYKKGDKNTRVYVSTLCVPCSKLCGDQGSDNRPEKLSV